jgi:hypothetical protein
VAVLAGRRAQPLIERLISIVKTLPPNPEEEIGFSKTNPADLLLQCFADEVQASPHLTREALKWGTKRSTWFPEVDLQFREGKYASIYDALCREEFTTSEEDFFVWGGVIGRNAHETRIFKSGLSDVVEEALNLLSSSDAFLRAKAFLILMEKAFSLHSQQPIAAEDASALKRCVPYIVSAMNDGQIFVQFSALWAHVWFCEALRDVHLTTGPMWEKLLQIWEIAKVEEVRFLAAWNLQMFPVGPRDSSPFRASAHLIKFARETIAATALPGYRRYHRANQVVAAIVAFYHSSVADDETIGSIIGSHIQPKSTDLSNNNLIEYLNSLDDVGHQYLENG